MVKNCKHFEDARKFRVNFLHRKSKNFPCAKQVSLNKQGAVELSAGFLVILILSIVIFGIGVMLISQVFTSAEIIKKNVDEQTASQTRAALKGNALLSLPFNHLDISRKSYDATALGIVNKLGRSETFFVSGSCNAALAGDGVTVLCDNDEGQMCDGEGAPDCSRWLTVDNTGINLDHNEESLIEIYVNIPADATSGNYVFDVRVCTERSCAEQGTSYESIKKLYIKVP